MKFKIPFTLANIEKLKKRSKPFSKKIRYKKGASLEKYLKNSDTGLTREDYIGICFRNFLVNFIYLLFISMLVLFLMRARHFIIFSFILSFLFSFFVFFSQMSYPRVYVSKKQKDIEKNLLSALMDILVQLNSGVPLFNIMTNISSTNYGVLSSEFGKAVKRISSGEPEPAVLNSIGENNPSLYFRRTLWQISNGMMAGSDMSIVVQDSIRALKEEQLIQIQDYGSKLNPLIVMYMLITVIIPTLSIAFLTIITSMIDIPENLTPLLFITLFVFVLLAQIMFLGIIRSKRPSLL